EPELVAELGLARHAGGQRRPKLRPAASDAYRGAEQHVDGSCGGDLGTAVGNALAGDADREVREGVAVEAAHREGVTEGVVPFLGVGDATDSLDEPIGARSG